jgi:hypothetical protein
MRQERAQRTANILYIIFTVLYWLNIAVVVLAAAGFLIQFILPEDLFWVNSESFGFTFDNAIYFKTSFPDPVNIKGFVQIFLLWTVPLGLMLLVGIRYLVKILKRVKEGDPFCDENIKSLSVIGFDLIAAAFLVNLAEIFLMNHLLKLFNIQNIQMNYSANIPYLLAGILVLLLAGIFNYGRFLKSEYDATV